MAKDNRHALALPGRSIYDRSNPRTQKETRREAATDEVKLDKRRQDFQHEGRELRQVIEVIQQTRKEIIAYQKKLDSAASHDAVAIRAKISELEAIYSDCFNIASLKGNAVLFEGLALVVDMLSVEQYVKNPETKEREYFRVTAADMLWDVAKFTELTNRKLQRVSKMLDTVGLKHEWWTKGQFIPVVDGREVDDEEEEEDDEVLPPVTPETVTAGVPATDLAAAKAQQERVIKMVRGENSAAGNSQS